MEWAFGTGELERVSGECPDESDGCYRLTKSLGSPHCWEGVCLGDLSSAKVYAFWVEKEIDYDGDTNIPIVDLVHFVYFPFNRGKNVEWFCYVPVYTVFGNHVGDWEHLTVRLMWKPENGLGGSTWPVWMRDDFESSIVEPEARPDQCNSSPSPANPFCGAASI